MNNFVHLHVHSPSSLLDAQASISNLVDRAINDGMKAIALTDHGSMFGVKEFFNYVKKKNSKYDGTIKSLKAELKELQQHEDSEEKNSKIEELKSKIKEEESHKFKPIIGCECYVAHRGRKYKEGKPDMSGWHLIVLANNLQ